MGLFCFSNNENSRRVWVMPDKIEFCLATSQMMCCYSLTIVTSMESYEKSCTIHLMATLGNIICSGSTQANVRKTTSLRDGIK